MAVQRLHHLRVLFLCALLLVGGCATMQVRQVNAVRYQTSAADPERKRIHGRDAITIGERNDELAFSNRVGSRYDG